MEYVCRLTMNDDKEYIDENTSASRDDVIFRIVLVAVDSKFCSVEFTLLTFVDRLMNCWASTPVDQNVVPSPAAYKWKLDSTGLF